MNFFLTKIRRLTTQMACIPLAILLLGCEDHNWKDGIRGRSDQFIARDLDVDDRLTRPEWERASGTLAGNHDVQLFDMMDCDHDGVVTWHEYSNYLFNKSRCQNSEVRSRTSSRTNATDVSDRYSYPMFCSPESVAEQLYGGYAEMPISNEHSNNVSAACAAPSPGALPELSYFRSNCTNYLGDYDSGASGYYSDLVISNRNTDISITLVNLQLTANVEKREEFSQSMHLKTVWIPPDSEASFRVWFGAYNDDNIPTEDLLCEIESAKGSLQLN